MFRLRLMIVFAVMLTFAFLVTTNRSRSEEPRQAEANSDSLGTIRIGSALVDAQRVLKVAKVGPGGLRAYSAHPDGDKWQFYSVRQGKVDLVVQYAPKSQLVTGLIVYHLGYPRSKTSDVSVTATSIEFKTDGSYRIHYPPPSASDSR